LQGLFAACDLCGMHSLAPATAFLEMEHPMVASRRLREEARVKAAQLRDAVEKAAANRQASRLLRQAAASSPDAWFRGAPRGKQLTAT
jgi:hypothetical protein